jgi:hypothetical protein
MGATKRLFEQFRQSMKIDSRIDAFELVQNEVGYVHDYEITPVSDCCAAGIEYIGNCIVCKNCEHECRAV